MIPDVGPVTLQMCKLQKMGWTVNVQRLDGTKVPVLVPKASGVSKLKHFDGQITCNSYSWHMQGRIHASMYSLS